MMYVTGHSILTSSRLGGYPPLCFLGANDLATWISRGWWQPSYFKKIDFKQLNVIQYIYMWMWRLIYNLMRNILEQKISWFMVHYIKDKSFWYLSNLYCHKLPVIVAWLGLLFGWYTTHHFSFKLTYTINRTHAAIVPRMESSYKIKLL